ncbi:MAG TPA: hypothetical protein DCE00_01350 [Firmicutes bacterium]|nr:hypothetical protein [Bacillota bacterium]
MQYIKGERLQKLPKKLLLQLFSTGDLQLIACIKLQGVKKTADRVNDRIEALPQVLQSECILLLTNFSSL